MEMTHDQQMKTLITSHCDIYQIYVHVYVQQRSLRYGFVFWLGL